MRPVEVANLIVAVVCFVLAFVPLMLGVAMLLAGYTACGIFELGTAMLLFLNSAWSALYLWGTTRKDHA